MNVIQFVHEGLGNSSYLVELPGSKAVLVDPDRTVGRYVAAARARGLKVDQILETHLHADFVSGAREAAAATGATILVPEGADSKLAHRPVRHGECMRLDGAEVEAIGSPGHTPEHLSYVLRLPGWEPLLFSGGSLIVGGAGRTDLLASELTDELSRAQFRTIRDAFRSLPDETILYPTHGGGSFCSTGSGQARASTLGRERKENPLLDWRGGEDEFAHWFPTTFPAVPAYFSRMRTINQAGPRLRREIPEPPAIDPGEFERAMARALVVDTRPQAAFVAAHIPGSLSIAFRDAFPTWLGWLVAAETPLLFVTGDEPLERVVDESLLVGYESFAGWLRGGIKAWQSAGRPVVSAALVDAAAAKRALLDGAAAVDVREPDEFAAGHIAGALHVPLGSLQRRLGEIPQGGPILTYCGHGDRSATALSLIERAGLGPVLNLNLGIDGWKEAGYSVVTGS